MTTLKERFQGFKEKLYSDITEVPDCFKQSHFPGLDGLRGVSILIVIAGHFGMYKGLYDTINGEIGVEIFFVISGFLITTLLLREKVLKGHVNFKDFYIRRLLRIMPVAYLVILILIMLNPLLELHVSFKSFLTSFLYLKNIPFKNSSEWYTGHFWSLSVEEQFYICFPFFVVYRTNKFVFLAILMITTLPILNILGFNNIGIFYSNRIVHVITFIYITVFGKGTASILVGSLLSILIFKKIIVIEKIRSYYFLSLGLFLLGCFILTRKSFLYVEFVSPAVFSIIIGYIILLNFRHNNLFRKLLDSHLVSKIGTLSYSLYVWQQLFTTNQKWHWFRYSDSIAFRIILLFLISFLSYNYFEKIFLRLKTKFSYQSSTIDNRT